MKCGIAAMIVWAVAGALCFGQRTETLNIQITDDKLVGTATLYAPNWVVNKGTVKVIHSDPALKVAPTAPYTITGDGRTKTLVVQIDYTKPIASVSASELTLTGVKDAKGGTTVVFKGQVPGFPSPTGPGVGSGPAASTRPPPMESSSENGDDPGQAKTNADAAHQTAETGFLPTNFHDWLLYGDTVALVLLLIGGGILFWRRERPQRSTAMEFPTRMTQPEVDFGSTIEQAKTHAQQARTQAGEAKQEALTAQKKGEAVGEQLKNLQKEFAVLRGLRLETMVAERNESLRLLAQALDELPQEPSAPARSGVAAAPREEAAAAAIVNRWLNQGAKERGQLLELAGELEIPAELMNHQDLNRVFDDLTTFEYPFALDADGPWLWVPIAGTQDFWAAPADAAFFGMGRAPSLLERLFEGMQKANQGFQFRTIYKPCRLRPVAGKEGLYTVVSKGLLRLEGASAPAAPAPKDFDSLVPEKTSMESGLVGSNPGKRLASWIRSTSRQLREQQKRVELATAAQKVPLPTGDFLSRREFKQQLDGVQRQIASVESKLRVRAVAPVAPLLPVAAQFLPTAAASADEKSVAAAESSAPEPLALQTEPWVTASVIHVDSGAIPDGWQEALLRSAEELSSEPETTGVPSEEVYVQRARNLAAELRKLDPASGAALVHLKRDQVHETFEVHETEASGNNPHEVVCTTCNATHTWQLAVCLGAREGEIAILYPLGGMSQGKYRSGYTGLIEDLPTASFTLAGIEEPARLQPIAGAAGTYTVTRKMRLVPAVSSEAAR